MLEQKKPPRGADEDIGRKYRKLAIPAVVAAVMAKTKKLNRSPAPDNQADTRQPRAAAEEG